MAEKPTYEELEQKIKKLEQEAVTHKQVEKILRESEEKHKTHIQNTPIGAISWDLNFKVIEWNPAAENIFSFSKVEAMGKHAAELILPDEMKEFVDSIFRELLSEKGGTYSINENITKNGRRIICEWYNTTLKDDTGKVIGVASLIHDITKRILAEEDRANLEEQLKHAQKMEAIGTLAGGIAHDFNNILGSIIGYSELLKEDIIGNKTSKHFIDQILKGGNRAKELVEQILLFSRQSEHDKIQVKITPLVKEIKKMLTASLPSTIEFKMNILTTHDFVLADPTQIHQILMNLCTNSAHAMGEKGGTLTIEIDQMNIDQDALKKFPDLKVGKYLKLQISDTGHGILPDVMDKIFDPFFSTKSRGEGTGLGLAVVHGIVKKYSGDIKAYSELGTGTTFIVLLPLIDKIEQKKSTENNFIPKGKEKILFVDDEQSLVDLEKTMLERLGYKVTAISDSQKAWHVFQKDPNAFDIVITDKTMPVLTGLELSKKVLGLCPEKPIIMCTGFGDEDSIKQAKEIGIKGYIHKPILNIKLAETIRNIFDEPDKGKI